MAVNTVVREIKMNPSDVAIATAFPCALVIGIVGLYIFFNKP